MRVIIAEKPSMARDIAKALGASERREGYIASAENCVTWCVGHLVELAPMEAYDAKLKSWSVESLPFIPEKFRYQVSDRTKGQFEVIKSLLNTDGVTSVVNACDAGREGELIFALVFTL